MKAARTSLPLPVLLVLLLVAVLLVPPMARAARGASRAQAASPAKGAAMQEAHGTFEVKLVADPQGPAAGIARRSLDKTYAGGLTGSSKGEMISAGDPASGNAGYVAIEQVDGKLDGKQGTFALMQTATMSKGLPPKLDMIVAPGSGTGELSGIYGTMTITVAASGAHSYTFRYSFAQ